MELKERQLRYKAIEEYRNRPLIVYATSTRRGVPAQMAGDAVREFIDQIDALSGEKSIDVLLHSTGGDALTAWKLMSVLRERFETVSVLVPYMAFSAATIFALGADEIVMHPLASLGPIDPQISIQQPDGSLRQFAYEDVGAFIRFLGDDAKIKNEQFVSAIIDKLFSVVDPINVGAAKRASELSSSVGERLLLTHMHGEGQKSQAKKIAEDLNKSFFAHGDAVSRKRALELQMKISAPDSVIENLVWDAYLGLESYMSLRTPFNPLQHYLSDSAAAASLKPTAPLQIPPNTPPQLAQQIWQTAAQQSIQSISQTAHEVEYHLINAIIESTRVSSQFQTSGKLSAFRDIKGEIRLSAVDTSSGWEKNK